MNQNTWESVEGIDFSRRKAKEWASIYKIELLEEPKDDRLWSEYEWAYNFLEMNYRPIINDIKKMDDILEEFGEKELRAIEIRRDIFMGASIGEKEILEERFIETEWIRNRLGFN